jgi:hypothetical protein
MHAAIQVVHVDSPFAIAFLGNTPLAVKQIHFIRLSLTETEKQEKYFKANCYMIFQCH